MADIHYTVRYSGVSVAVDIAVEWMVGSGWGAEPILIYV